MAKHIARLLDASREMDDVTSRHIDGMSVVVILGGATAVRIWYDGIRVRRTLIA